MKNDSNIINIIPDLIMTDLALHYSKYSKKQIITRIKMYMLFKSFIEECDVRELEGELKTK
jgi:hypothetical protein